ncbi:MAG: adenylate kinase family protein [Candidatus Aenigmarchaeota archaeon]|nr:adenylate kinase family protein [Candidatus Aenigmarchaeota archaeon]
MIIAITGTPCAGKTAVSKELAELLHIKAISLNLLAGRENLFSSYDRRRKCKVVDMEKLKKEIRKISKTEKNLIIESHYSHCLNPDIVIILRCSTKALIERMKKRGWPKKKIEENIEAEIMEMAKFEAVQAGLEVYEFDGTDRRPKEIATGIAKLLREKGCL